MKTIQVQFDQDRLINCTACKAILFEVKAIDSYAFVEDQRYFILRTECIPINKSALSTLQHFNLMHLAPVLCRKCSCQVGILPETVNKHLKHILNKVLIQAKEDKIGISGKANLFRKIIQTLEHSSDKENDANRNNKQNSKQLQQQPKQSIQPKENQHIVNALQDEAKMLQTDLMNSVSKCGGNQPQAPVVKEIIGSMGFFMQVLEGLQKRAEQIQQVSKVLKKKVERLVPEIRKN